MFSYLDTQMLRLHGPNFHELPINQPVCPFHNNQRDSQILPNIPVDLAQAVGRSRVGRPACSAEIKMINQP